jgi:CBS domain-containing protein
MKSYITTIEKKLSEEEELKKAFSWAKEYNVIEVPVFSSNLQRFVGMVDLRAYISPSYDLLRTKLKHLVIRYKTLKYSEFTPEEAARIMHELNYRAVPVISDENEDQLVGVSYDHDILRYLYDQKFGKEIKINSLQLRPPVTLRPEDTLAKAITTMRKHGIGRLLITDEKGKLVGIVTRSTVFNLIVSLEKEKPREGEYVTEKFSVFKYPVKEIMEYPVYTIEPNKTIYHALRLMLQYNIRAITVAQDNKPLGVITSRDIIRLFVLSLPYKFVEEKVIYQIKATDPEIREFIERTLRLKRFPEGSIVEVTCEKRASTKNIFDIRVRVRLPNGKVLIYSDVARGKVEAFRRVKKGIDVLHHEAFEEEKPPYYWG